MIWLLRRLTAGEVLLFLRIYSPKARTHMAETGRDVADLGEGRSLRDWFAGQALAGMIGSFSNTNEALARSAYRVADAMLAARKEGQGGGS